MPIKEPKPKSCKYCGSKFIPFRSTAICCSYGCATKWVASRKEKLKAQEAKIERKLVKERKEAIKTLRDYIKEAQIAFNAYIRYRDKDKPCISCGKPLQEVSIGGKYDAGHFFSTGAAPHLRFEEDNCHAQCKKCNNWLSGNVVNYRVNLISRIGLVAVEELEANNEIKKWTIDEVKAIKDYYKTKLKNAKSGVQ